MADKTQNQDPYPGILAEARKAEANVPSDPFRDLLNLPEDQRSEILGKLSPKARQRLYMKISTPGRFTPGERYQFQKALQLLPQVTQTTLLPPAPRDQTAIGRTGQAVGSVLSGELVGRTRERLGEVAQEAGQLASEYQTAQGPQYAGGRYVGERGVGQQAVNDLLSGLYATTQVGAKLAAGFTDPKTLAAFIVSKLGPAGALAAATYFGYQGVSGLADAIRSGKLTPESLQNGLLGMAGVAGAAGMGAESGKGRVIAPMNLSPAEIKGSVRATARSVLEPAAESLRPLARRSAGAAAALRKRVFEEAQQYPEDVKAQQKAVGKQEQRTEAQRQLENHSTQAKNNVEGVEAKAYQEANRRFESTRQLIGAGQPGEPELPPGPLLDTVREAEASFEGHPESITLFRQILKMEGDTAKVPPGELRRATMEKHGIAGKYEDLAPDEKQEVDRLAAQAMKGGEPLTWDKLQRIKTSAEDAMRKPSTPHIVKRALRAVDDKAVELMGQMADTVPNARATWQGARDFWREWREDFHTPTGRMGSRSPLTGIRDAVDPYAIRNEILRTQGVDIGNNRASQTLRKPMYAQFGGAEAADSVDQAVRTHRSIQETPKPSLSALQPVEQPTVNAEAVSRKALEDRARQWGTMNRRDIGIIGSGIVGALVGFALKQDASSIGAAFLAYEATGMTVPRLLERPAMQSWLLRRVPVEEMTALRKIPGADKVRVINTITDMGVEAARRGIVRRGPGGINLSPDLQNFIGDVNVQRIVTAAAAARRSPGQQIRDLRKIHEKFSDNPAMPIGPGQ